MTAKEEKQQKEMQEKYTEFQHITQQVQQVQQQMEQIDNNFIELEATKQSIDELGDAKEGQEILVPLNSGIFVQAEIKDNKACQVNVGAGVVAEKKLPEIKKMLEEQEKDIQTLKSQMQIVLEQLQDRAQKIEKKLIELASK